MKGETIVNRVVHTIRDPDVSRDEILEVVNEALIAVAGRVLLPPLETVADVDTVVSESAAALPDNFQHGLFDCQDVALDKPVTVVKSKRQILAKYGRMTYVGDVRHVCASVGSLLYNPIPPEAKTMRLSFYEFPTVLKEGGTPDCLPAEFHRVLIHYAAFIFFDLQEDDVDGKGPNTEKHERIYERLVEELKLVYKEGKSHPPPPITVGEYL